MYSSPLACAMTMGAPSLVEELLDARADPTMTTDFGSNAFVYGCFAGKADNVRKWLDYFGGTWDLDRRERITNGSALTVSVGRAAHANEDLLLVLLAARACPHAVSGPGRDILGLLHGHQKVEKLRLLLKAG